MSEHSTPSADAPAAEPRRRRLDEMRGPGWVGTMATLFRGVGIAVALLLLALGFVTGSFFLLLTVFLASMALVAGFLLGRLVTRETWYERPNARSYSIALLIGLPLVLVVIAQLAGPALTPAATTSRCLQGELALGEAQDLQLAIDPRINTMEFTIEVPLVEGGALRWWLTDPVGEVPWGGRAEADGFTDIAEPTPLGGQWIVSLRGEAERAQYIVRWRGATNSQPMPAEVSCE